MAHLPQAQQSRQAVMRARLVAENWLDLRSKQLTDAMESGRNSKVEIDMRLDCFSKCYQDVVKSQDMVTAAIELEEIPEVIESMAAYREAKEFVRITAIIFLENLGKHHGKLCLTKAIMYEMSASLDKK